jgi:hypothetical protein
LFLEAELVEDAQVLKLLFGRGKRFGPFFKAAQLGE